MRVLFSEGVVHEVCTAEVKPVVVGGEALISVINRDPYL